MNFLKLILDKSLAGRVRKSLAVLSGFIPDYSSSFSKTNGKTNPSYLRGMESLLFGTLLFAALGLFSAVSHAQIQFQNSSFAENNGTGDFLVIPRPTGVQVDDFLFATIAVLDDEDADNSGPAGWTELSDFSRNAGDDEVGLAIFWKVATAADVSATNYSFFIAENDFRVGTISRYTGVDTSSPIVVHDGDATGDSTAATADSVNIVGVTDTKVVRSLAHRWSSSTTPPAGHVERVDENYTLDPNDPAWLIVSVADQDRATTGNTGTATFNTTTWDGGVEVWVAATTVLRPAPSVSLVGIADDAWQSSTYSGGGGVRGWASNWTEGGADTGGSTTGGQTQIRNQTQGILGSPVLVMRGSGSGAATVTRTVDLTGYTNLRLLVEWGCSNTDGGNFESNDVLQVQVSYENAAFQTLAEVDGNDFCDDAGEDQTGTFSNLVLLDRTTGQTNTRIRLSGNTSVAAEEWIFDDVVITGDPTGPQVTIDLETSTVAALSPPDQADYSIVVENDQSGTTAEDVVVSNTLPAGFTYRSSSISATGSCVRTSVSNPQVGQSILSWGTWNIDDACVVTIDYTTDVSVAAGLGVINDDAQASGSNFTTASDDGSDADEDVTVECSGARILNTVTASASTTLHVDSVLTDNVCSLILDNSGFISGTVWLDEDQDGINDIEEARLTNVEVELVDDFCIPLPAGNADCRTVLTDQFGNYAFTELLAGDYDIIVVPSTLPSGITNTAGEYGQPTRNVVLNQGQEVTNQDFGYIANSNTGIIGDRVWSDQDGDGIQDVGEAGLAGVTLTLRDASGSIVDTTTSDADGDYHFTGVPFDEDYTVTVTNNAVLSGFSPTVGPQSEGSYVSSPITLTNAITTITDIDFGFDSPNTLTIEDRVWFDADADQTQDPGEPGIAGVTINLLNASGQVVATSVTDLNGDFSFSGIPDGSNYTLQVADGNNALELMSETTGTDGDETITGLLSDAADDAGATDVLDTVGDDGSPTFGYNRPGSIAGLVWSDAAGPTGPLATQDNGEPGIGGVTVTLTPPAFLDIGAGVGNPITTVTNPDGSYRFDDLPPADYTVEILVADRPSFDTHTKDPDTDQDHATVVNLPLGESIINQDFGYREDDLNPINGSVFLDRDKDGVYEPDGNDGVPANADDETGFEGVTLALKATYEIIDGSIDIDGNGVINASDDGTYAGYPVIDGRIDFDSDGVIDGDDDGFIRGVDVIDGGFDVNGDDAISATDDDRVVGDTIATTTSDSNGDYTFSGVADGDYVVQVTDDDGVVAGYDITSGLDALDVNVNGLPVDDVDFGYIKDEETGSISGEVWIDEAVINGVADDSETNLSGVSVYLCEAPVASPPCDPTDPEYLAETVTDARGEYIFDNLPSGSYVVDSDPTTVPSDLELTVDPDPIAVSEGENVSDVDIGYEPDTDTGALSGFVWTDVDSDGFYDAGEAPIGGVTIYVYRSLNSVIATAVTKPDGSWIVTGITGPDLNGNIKVGYEPTDIPATLVQHQPSNMPPGQDRYFPVNLASDADRFIGDLNFGFPPEVASNLGSIVGTIYSDADANSTYSESVDGEFQAVTLNLLDCGGDGCGNANDVIIASTSTDSNGDYSFAGLADGEYRVVVSDVGDVLQDLNPLETLPASLPINAIDGRDKTNINAGYVSNTLFGSVGNRFWFDINNNGIIDDDEPGIEGITIQCWADNDNSETPNDPTIPSVNVVPELGVDNLIRTVVTDENGEYYCTSLPTGQYIVRVFDSLDFNEADDGTTVTGSTADHRAKPWTYTLTTASPNLTADFGVNGSNSLAGKVFIEDESLVEPDLDGTVDPGVELDGSTSPTGGPTTAEDVSADTPAAGVTVALYIEQPNGSFSFVSNTVTDANGDYSFGGLPDGDYRVVVQPSGSVIDGFGQTGDPDLVSNALGHGDEDLVCDSPTSGLCDNASVQTLSGGTTTSGVNFGYQKNFVTTPVTLTMFHAEQVSGGVLFKWESMNEVAHFGYQIYAREADGWRLITDLPIVAEQNLDALALKQYEYFVGGQPSTWYSLVDVSTSEVLTLHGPYRLNEVYGSKGEELPTFDWSQVQGGASSLAQTLELQNAKQMVNRLRSLETDPEAIEADDGEPE